MDINNSRYKDLKMQNDLNQILISYTQPDFEEKWMRLRAKVCVAAAFGSLSDEAKKVVEIIEDVRKRKFEAVAEYTKKFDNVDLAPEQFRISKEELRKAHKEIDKDLLASIRKSIKNVRKYQQEIFIGNFKHTGIKYTPIERVGICVPGASAPLPSTVIMCAVPAQVAGVKEIVVVS
ncbi:MAG: histidinol dehydrogenase, partial [Planctomycetes bacterium]|nr:histidinol dehydrogenase [Planctomycetota bacterium]